MASQAVVFIGFLYKHRRQLSSTGAGHPNPFDMIRKLHHDLSGRNTKADPEFDLIVLLAERTTNLTRGKHFFRWHRSPLSAHARFFLTDSFRFLFPRPLAL
jgi:hypothetical protein